MINASRNPHAILGPLCGRIFLAAVVGNSKPGSRAPAVVVVREAVRLAQLACEQAKAAPEEWGFLVVVSHAISMVAQSHLIKLPEPP